jgi:hypothetical protein
MNYLQHLAEFTTVEEGEKNLKEAIAQKNKMGGAMYYNILNDDCIEINNKLENLKWKTLTEIQK